LGQRVIPQSVIEKNDGEPAIPFATRVVLTPVGIETVERARRIIKDIEDLVSFTASAREQLSGALRMRAIPTVGPFLLPRVLPGFASAWLREISDIPT